MPITEGGRFSPVNDIVSPGVFTRENDLSGVAQGVADIGAAVVAPFPKGPGFSPTLIESSADLEEKFGVADGVYYGPYTAKEYLKEKGFVTVCRVGALTGYHQKYPFVIYAIKGTWDRANDIGGLVTGSTYVVPTAGTVNNAYSQSIKLGSSTGSMLMSLTATFGPLSATGNHTPIPSGSYASGSKLYYGQTLDLGVVGFTASAAGNTGNYGSNTTTLKGLFLSSSFTASVVGTISGVATTSPFYGTEVSGTVSVVNSLNTSCAPTFYLSGSISGSFGQYTGDFSPTGTVTYNACSGSWTSNGNAEYKVLAVLNDTQNATINSSLEAPGFSGSTMITASALSASTTVPRDYNLTLKSSDSTSAYGTYQFSINPASVKYITNVFGNKATAGDPDKYVTGTKKEAAYLYKLFENEMAAVAASPESWYISGSFLPDTKFAGEPLKFVDAYSLDLNNGDSGFGLTNASTPWIVSQAISSWDGGSDSRFNLFKAHTLSDGTNTNTSYKIEISKVKLAGTVAGSDWGSFTLTVRKYSDTDKKPVILEQFNNLNLDPDSSNYIARRIGDRYDYIDFNGKILEFGTYANRSKYIRIEMEQNPWPTTAVPYGFAAYTLPINSAAGWWCPPMKYTKASVYATNPGKYPSGITFDDAPAGASAELMTLYPTSSTGIGASDDNKQYFAPIPEFGAYSSVGRNELFALDVNYTGSGVMTSSFISASNAIPAVYDAANETTYVKMRKFVLGFQGGFDGQSPSIPINVGGDITAGNTQGLNCTNINSAGSIAYKQCMAALGNPDEFDINMVILPGIIHQHHSYVTNLVVDTCEARGDCFYIMDLYTDDGNPTSGQIAEVLGYADDFDTSYAAAYYPWVKIKDVNTNKYITVPPSVVLPAVYAANDKVAGEWWAPAGLNRGGILPAEQVTDRVTHAERDDLYEGRVNPIARFPGLGISAWGQRTLQVDASALDRINVRRLLIEIKKYFASVAKYLVFEQNTAATRNKFISIVNPFLQGIQQRSGLYAFDVVMDDSNNTADLIDRNILYGQIYLKPTKTAEEIILDFNILPTGAAFPNA